MTHSHQQLEHDALHRILDVAVRLGATADLTEILSLIIDAMRDVLDADRATVFQYDAATDELFTAVAHGISGEGKATEIRIPATAGLAGECAQSRAIVNVPDAYADPRFNQQVDKDTGYRTNSILCVPLIGHDDELVGVTQVLNKSGGPFDENDASIARALGAQAAVAVKRGRLLEDMLVKEKLERDLHLARNIQQSSFPSTLPKLAGFDLSAYSEPADETGGDTYDLVESNSGVTMVMADATGHGVGPALSVTQLRSMLRMAVRLDADLDAIARHVNHQLCQDLPSGRFITAWIGVLDAVSGELTTISAGQAPLLHYHARTDELETLGADGLPLGIVDEFDDPPTTVKLEPGDFYIVMSDGIFEAMDPDDKQFGDDRVAEVIRANAKGTARQLQDAMTAAVEHFARGRAPDDDRTGIFIKREGAS